MSRRLLQSPSLTVSISFMSLLTSPSLLRPCFASKVTSTSSCCQPEAHHSSRAGSRTSHRLSMAAAANPAMFTPTPVVHSRLAMLKPVAPRETRSWAPCTTFLQAPLLDTRPSMALTALQPPAARPPQPMKLMTLLFTLVPANSMMPLASASWLDARPTAAAPTSAAVRRVCARLLISVRTLDLKVLVLPMATRADAGTSLPRGWASSARLAVYGTTAWVSTP
mmetsp:Transcript_49573/g.156039  ORF Transcript_49573/g.156039 Transcript_49573/m.156039 type:complete len:223 (-) Transcript_49573:269-937(-)